MRHSVSFLDRSSYVCLLHLHRQTRDFAFLSSSSLQEKTFGRFYQQQTHLSRLSPNSSLTSNHIRLRPSTQPRLRTSIATEQSHLHPLPNIVLLPRTPTIDLVSHHLIHGINTAAPIQRIRHLGALVAVDVEIEAVGPVAVLGLVADVAALVDQICVLAGGADEVGADGGDGEVGERDVEVGARALDVAGGGAVCGDW